MAKKKPKMTEEFDEMPSGDEAAKRWREFMVRLDALTENVSELADMGQTIILALKEAAEQTQNPLMGLIQQVVQGVTEARKFYSQERAARKGE